MSTTRTTLAATISRPTPKHPQKYHSTITIQHRIDRYIDYGRIPPGETEPTQIAHVQLQEWLKDPRNDPLTIATAEYQGHQPHPLDPTGDTQPVFRIHRTDGQQTDMQYHPKPQYRWHTRTPDQPTKPETTTERAHS